MKKSTSEDLLYDATCAFWEVVVKRFPEATTGDLSPLTTVRFDEAARVAIEEWIWANVPRRKR